MSDVKVLKKHNTSNGILFDQAHCFILNHPDNKAIIILLKKQRTLCLRVKQDFFVNRFKNNSL